MKVDLNKNYQPYFEAYLKVHGIKHNDEVKFVDYSKWIQDKHDKFQHLKRCLYYNGYSPEIQTEFQRFIEED